MKNLNPINQNYKVIFSNIVNKKQTSESKTNLINLMPKIKLSFDNYEINKLDLENISDSTYSESDKKDLHKCFESKTSVGNTLIEDIRNNQDEILIGKCQYCGIDTDNTIDHYLPKEVYPEFSMHGLNLIPSCSICNTDKKIKFKSNITGNREIINLYFDDISSNRFLYVVLDTESKIFTFELKNNNNNFNQTKFEIIENHFSNLKLFKKYKKEAIRLLIEKIDLFKHSNYSTIRLKEDMKEEFERFYRLYGKNYYKSIILECIYNNFDSLYNSSRN